MSKLIPILFLFLAACKEAYDPPVVSISRPRLVVDGFINNGTYFATAGFIPVGYTTPANDSVLFTYTYCGDCTKTGSHFKPSFWP